MGLEELGLFNQITDPQQSSPLGTLSALKALRATATPGMTQTQSVNQGTPFKSTGLEMPDFSGGNADAAMEQGAKRAERDATTSKTDTKGGLQFNSSFVDLAKAMAPTNDDRNGALTHGGIGMALAGGQTGNFLTALAAGLGGGQDYFDKMRAARAERALKEGELNSNIAYRQGSLGVQNRQADIAGQTATSEAALRAAQASAVPSEIALRGAQGTEAQATAELKRAQARATAGGEGGVPAKIMQQGNAQAEKEFANVPMTPENQAKKANRAFSIMLQNGQVAGFDVTGWKPPQTASPVTPSENAASAGAPPIWVSDPTGVQMDEVTSKQLPILGNPAVTAPGSRAADILQNISAGAIDFGSARNMGETALLNLKGDLLALSKKTQGGGFGTGSQMKLIDQMVAKPSWLASNPQAYDELNSLWGHTYQQLQQDARTKSNPDVASSVRKDAQERFSIESRILFNLGKDKKPEDYPRYSGPGGPKAPSGPAIGTKVDGWTFNGGNPADKSNWSQ